MHQIIKIFLTLSILSLSFTACSSQEERRARWSPEERAKQLKERLDLTDVQADSIKKIFMETDQKMRKLRESFSREERGAMREQMMSIREEIDSRIKAVLFEDQIEEYEKFREEQRENMRQRFRNRN